MGTKKARKAMFLAAHPLCCFCGGDAPSAEPDHVPGRATFCNREWPVGYEFPACVACNRATSLAEQVVALLSRIHAPNSKEGKAVIGKLMQEVRNNHPGLLEEMAPSVRQRRDARSKYGVMPAVGAAVTSMPILSVRGPLVNAAIEQFARKLFCALYYKHTGKIVGHSGGIAYQWFSNLQIEADEIPRELSKIFQQMPPMVRNSVNLDDQFFYLYGATEQIAAFLAFFNRSFAILGMVHQAPPETSSEGSRILRPLKHTKLN